MLQFALCALFVTSTQVVSSLALSVNFTKAEQCQPFTFSLQGQPPKGHGRPTSLSIIPFDSNPVVVPISAITEGSYTTFLPYPARTKFIASLEDGAGSIIEVSKVMEVAESLKEDSDECVDLNPSPIRPFTIQDTLSQCKEFTLSYHNTTLAQAPTIRAYNPGGFSLALNVTSSDSITGTARYMMGISAGKNVVLLIDGGNGVRKTTGLLTVAGDSSSPRDCLGKQQEIEAAMTEASPDISARTIIIGSAAGGGAVVVVAVCMCFYVILEKKKRRKAQHMTFDGTRMQRDIEEKKPPLPTLFVTPAPRGTTPEPSGMLAKFKTPKRELRTDSLASWVQATPDDQKVPASSSQPQFLSLPRHQSLAPSLAQSESRNVMPQPTEDRERVSINSLDIEGMLNMASMQSEAARKGSAISFFGTDLTPAPPETRPQPRIITDTTVPRRMLKVNSDIPDDLQSAYSRDSVNPFTTPVYGPESPQRIPARNWVTPAASSGTAAGLPSSPRDVGRAPGRVSVARSNSVASSDWYGFGVAR